MDLNPTPPPFNPSPFDESSRDSETEVPASPKSSRLRSFPSFPSITSVISSFRSFLFCRSATNGAVEKPLSAHKARQMPVKSSSFLERIKNIWNSLRGKNKNEVKVEWQGTPHQQQLRTGYLQQGQTGDPSQVGGTEGEERLEKMARLVHQLRQLEEAQKRNSGFFKKVAARMRGPGVTERQTLSRVSPQSTIKTPSMQELEAGLQLLYEDSLSRALKSLLNQADLEKTKGGLEGKAVIEEKFDNEVSFKEKNIEEELQPIEAEETKKTEQEQIQEVEQALKVLLGEVAKISGDSLKTSIEEFMKKDHVLDFTSKDKAIADSRTIFSSINDLLHAHAQDIGKYSFQDSKLIFNKQQENTDLLKAYNALYQLYHKLSTSTPEKN